MEASKTNRATGEEVVILLLAYAIAILGLHRATEWVQLASLVIVGTGMTTLRNEGDYENPDHETPSPIEFKLFKIS